MPNIRSPHGVVYLIAALLALSALACSLSGQAPTVTVPATLAPSATAALVPTVASVQTATEATTVPKPTIDSTPLKIQIYLIAIGDKGQAGKLVGCDDSVVPVQVEIPNTQGVLRATLDVLLSNREQYYGQSGLYNALYQSDLKVDKLVIENGTATIGLMGTLQLGGECDNPRVQAQLEETARQFSTVQQVAIFVNGTPLKDILSLK